VSRRGDSRLRTDPPAATVTPYPDGPLILRGDFGLVEIDGTEIEHGGVIALCRCGRSARKPFCDGNHKLTRERPHPVD
jgi:CDGSH-type Zn-finger protein